MHDAPDGLARLKPELKFCSKARLAGELFQPGDVRLDAGLLRLTSSGNALPTEDYFPQTTNLVC